ncbi:MAG: CD225/dispanin family protein [Dysgonamonadaceae bacterium]|nr:CD225/dispanin family protein [Dysgonamonadaceae bacterium]MDD4728143.1 CD225/dispanin family protein [Dysgonamonadaceae bacterium]
MENQFTTPPPQGMDIPIRPKSWLVASILTTIFCCLPFGIVGIINAAKVNSLYDQGLYDESKRVSANAKKWTMIGVIVGIVYYIIVFIVAFMGYFTQLGLPGTEGLTF